ncbi:MAG: restriction endonuclease subunit S [Nitrospirae bacterium]|nr:restriction endonuclease subunit S [Nitrospirota bacterium]
MVTYSIIKKSQIEGIYRLDAEYYQPEYLSLMKSLKIIPNVELNSLAFVTDGIHSSIDYDNKSNIRCLSAQSVQDNYFDLSANTFISEDQHKVNLRTSLKVGDAILSSVGTIGNCAVITDSILPANADRHVAIIRLSANKLSPYFLSVFLNSKYGRFQTLRESTGNVQPNLFIDKIKKLIIPTIKNHREISELAEKSNDMILAANLLYSQAENLFLEELGLKNFKPQENLSYVVNLSDVKSARRADAEYFQPKYKRMVEKIKKHNLSLLGDPVTMKKGFEPGSNEYQDKGKLFIRVSSISKHGIIDKDQKYLSGELYQKLRKDFEPKIGEILLTKDATPGIAYVLKEAIEGVVASGIMRLKLKENIEAEYLTLCINSIVGQMQIERDAGGSIIAHWKPEQIKNLQLPIFPKPTQQKIADLVRQSHEARKKAKELLEEAKRKVEEEIENN